MNVTAWRLIPSGPGYRYSVLGLMMVMACRLEYTIKVQVINIIGLLYISQAYAIIKFTKAMQLTD